MSRRFVGMTMPNTMHKLPSAFLVTFAILCVLSSCGGEGETPTSALTDAAKRDKASSPTTPSDESQMSNDNTAKLISLGYLATWPDLIQVFGDNYAQAEEHRKTVGALESRELATDQFDVASYLSSNPEVVSECEKDTPVDGIVVECEYRSFILRGWKDSRNWTELFALSYIASYGDLMTSLGADPTSARRHYAAHGLSEGRNILFNSVEWAHVKHPYVEELFDSDYVAVTRFYINNHGRVPDEQTTYTIENTVGSCLSPQFGDVRIIGGAVVPSACSSAVQSYQWYFEAKSGLLRNKADPSRCLMASQLTSGAAVVIAGCDGDDSRQIWVNQSGNRLLASDADDGSVLCVDSSAFGEPAVLRQCSSAKTQEWHLISQGNSDTP